ncbi:LAMTOR3 [Lepeophtheirus salmonis]|uniref:LAMTOR3 n=1 Tax=Lepeophtheirus salmonis TaxID=72036 RepID=A0A7R8D537_LEPSM|nr:LAMTOR3 [Lepeophtheirus salmonis]CAF3029505.1 LAMTOR3 [Lepeophtheirus salmonis]
MRLVATAGHFFITRLCLVLGYGFSKRLFKEEMFLRGWSVWNKDQEPKPQLLSILSFVGEQGSKLGLGKSRLVIANFQNYQVVQKNYSPHHAHNICFKIIKYRTTH